VTPEHHADPESTDQNCEDPDMLGLLGMVDRTAAKAKVLGI
jgi:hypothetical protein